MTIAPIGNFHMMPFGGNPIQNLGTVALTAIAVNAIASLPMAAAREAPNLEKEVCEVLCAPLPGDAKDAPEKTCQEICKQGGIVTKTRQWIGEKAGPWIKNTSNTVFSAIDCSTNICSERGMMSAIWDSGKAVWMRDVTSAPGIVARAGCTALLAGNAVVPNTGYMACMACCTALKATGNG